MNKNISLVILAAGMGSRYGGLKQIDTVGSQGESIIDFSIYDAIEAGFNKLYLIIREEHQSLFEEHLIKNIRSKIDVEYVFQKLTDCPEGFSVPEGREKPWGTSHALQACRHQVKEPFMICNADDYYGKQAFKDMASYLTNEVNDKDFSMVGFSVENTLTDNGTVTRGVCQSKEQWLSDIVEISNLKAEGDNIVYEEEGQWVTLPKGTLVSMNFWGFTPHIFTLMNDLLVNFFKTDVPINPLKSECLLPTDIGTLVHEKKIRIRILPSVDRWFGVTYKEDKPFVVETLQGYKNNGYYPEYLWK